jgi:3-methyladenine DNA glycosylase Tag
MTENDVQALMKNTDVVRNERKIRATVQNAKTMLQLKKEFGSMEGFIGSFGKQEAKLLESLQEKFNHLGPSSARMFLWMAKYPLTPTKEEKTWMKGHHDRHEIHE